MDILLLVTLFFFGIIIVLCYQIISNINFILFCLALLVIELGVLILLIRVFYKMNENNGSNWFFIDYIAIIGFWVYGVLFISDLKDLDMNNIYFKIFKDYEILSCIIPFFIVFFIALGILLIVYYCKKRHVILCLIPVIFMVAFCLISSKICTKSYSDYTVSEFGGSDNLARYQISKDTPIYYPSSVGFLFPGFCPIHYSSERFKEGEIVYANEERILCTYWTEKEYVEVTDGKRAGFIKRDILK